MNTKRSLILAVLILIGAVPFLILVQPAKSASQEAEIGGFLLPFDNTGDYNISENTHQGNAIDIRKESPGVNFNILAPKDGVVIYADDQSPDSWTGDCTNIEPATNYIVIGHGPRDSDGKYQFYTMYYHLAYDSLGNLKPGDHVKVGDNIGIAGRTGHSTGIHLHLVGTDEPVNVQQSSVFGCGGHLLSESRTWVTVSSTNSKPIGFEEYGNLWPLLDGGKGDLKQSFNHEDFATQDCDIRYKAAILYNHVDYGGECFVIDPGIEYNVPSGFHASSIYLNPEWIALGNVLHMNDADNFTGLSKYLSSSVGDLREIKDTYSGNHWNDRIKSVWFGGGTGYTAVGGYTTHHDPTWLLEFSKAEKPPVEVDLHLRVDAEPGVYDAHRVLVDGNVLYETSAGEYFHTWNTYGWSDGYHTLRVEYRRLSDNGNWGNALSHEETFYLSPNRSTYAPCDGGTGAILTSGSDCIRVTENVSDLAFAGWGDRSDLSITASGYDVLSYDSCCFQGAPKLIKDGQTSAVGGNVSSIELRTPLSDAAYIPEAPLGSDSNTIAYFQLDEGGGSTVFSSVGSLVGTLTGGSSFVSGRFNGAVHTSNPPEGSGVNFGAVDFGSPFTVELFVKLDSVNGDQRIATQLGGGPNTGYNKWLIGLVGGRFRAWACYIHGCHEGYSLENVQPDKWYYLMLSYDGATSAKFYVDSILQKTISMDGILSPGATTFEIGQGEGIYGCNCTIDEVRVSNIARMPVGPPAPTPTPLPTATPIATPTPTPEPQVNPTPTPLSEPSGGTELLSQPWHLEGNNGAAEAYQEIDSGILQGKDTIRITYDLNGLNVLGGDASAIIFDQSGWQYISLSDYGQNGLDGSQYVDVPLSDFPGLDPNAPVGTLHARFWYSDDFAVDITSIVAYDSQSGSPTGIQCSSITEWRAEYWDNMNLSGEPVLCRNETEVNYDFLYGGPDPSLPSDHFSARYTRTMDFAGGRYQFRLGGDDGVRLWADDNLVIDGWKDQPYTEYVAELDLAPGGHTFKVEYYENGGGAIVSLRWKQIVTSACPSITEWQAEYWDNMSLSGEPVLCRNETEVNKDFQYGSPDPTLSEDRFSARYTRSLDFAGGSYRFNLGGDDGVRLWVDGNMVIDGWKDQPYTEYHGEIQLDAGSHTLKVEYYENTGGAIVTLRWEQIAATGCPSITEWQAEYWDNMNLSGDPVLCRDEMEVNNDFQYGGPDPSLPSDQFSARYTRSLDFAGGSYRFNLGGDDGVRLWVDGNMVIDGWKDQPYTEYASEIQLDAGSHALKVEYYENTGGAIVTLRWEQVAATGCPFITEWQAEYWDNMNLSGDPVLCRNETEVNNDFQQGGPDPNLPSDQFSARYNRIMEFTGGLYQFRLGGDDGVRLWVDDNLVIDGWKDQPYTEYSAEIDLGAGSHSLRVEYYENDGSAIATLRWELLAASN
jgi:hypothetical protein